MKRTIPALLGLATLSLLFTACTGAGVQRAEGVTAMVAGSPPSAVMDALITGELTITETGCLAVTAADVTYPLQFPFGTRLSADGAEVTVPGLPTLRLGDTISGGGGYLHLTDVDPACVADNKYEEYAIWQTVGE